MKSQSTYQASATLQTQTNDFERLQGISLVPSMDGDGWHLTIETTHRKPIILITSCVARQVTGIIAQAPIGDRVVILQINENESAMDLVTESRWMLWIR